MQPTSTRRWPWTGSSPVVSVSRTISRMMEACEESLSPYRHFSNTGENITHLITRGVKTLRRIHHEIRSRAFFRVRYLFRENRREFFFGHAWALEGAGALHFGRRRNNNYRVAPPFAACLEKQWNVQDRHGPALA